MTDTIANAQQREFWNGNPVKNWVNEDETLEAVHGVITPRILAHAAPARNARVFDIGCGSGAVSQAFADAAPDGEVTGIDISVPLLLLARTNHGNAAAFLEADAQTYAFPPETADLIVSRFGVMFFEDPAAAFANMLVALKPGGRLCVACWGPIEDNPWFNGPHKVIEAYYGPQPRPERGAPGPMAFSDPADVIPILTEAGFANARVETEDFTFTHPQGASGAAQLMAVVGPIGKAVREQGGDRTERAQLADSLTEVFMAYEHPAEDSTATAQSEAKAPVTDDDPADDSATKTLALPARIHFYLAERPPLAD